MAAISPTGGSITGVAGTDVVKLQYGNAAELKRVTVEELLTGPGILALQSHRDPRGQLI